MSPDLDFAFDTSGKSPAHQHHREILSAR